VVNDPPGPLIRTVDTAGLTTCLGPGRNISDEHLFCEIYFKNSKLNLIFNQFLKASNHDS
jgi:hypothetical protein